MDNSFFMGLVYNAALLLTMVFIFDLTTSSFKKNHSYSWQVLAGIIIGGIGFAVMETNWELLPGVIFDTRTVILGISGLFFGWITTLIAMVTTAAYRIYLGGSGTIAGVSEIVMASMLGLVWRQVRGKKLHQISWLELYLLGLLIHTIDLLFVLLLPAEIRREVFSQIWFPLVTINPLVFLMLGSLMSGRLKRELMVIEISKSREALRATLESTTDGILAVDNDEKIIFANRRFSELWRIPQSLMEKGDDQTLLNFVLSQLIDPDSFVKKVKALYASDIVDMDILLFKDGRSFERYSIPMTINAHRIGRVWSFRDVTKVREVDKMKTDFVSLASHQLRSPLTGIKWFVELLTSDTVKVPPEKVQEYLRNIGKSNQRMIDLVSDLLIIARIEGGRTKREIINCTIKCLLQNALDDQKIILKDKKIEILGLDGITPDLKVEVDTVQLVQVFGNLINNATSYSPEGSQIELGAEQIDGHVTVTIKDHGLGIPRAQQAKIFDKFFRGDNVAKTTAGSGLGLYVAKSMVESHGGKIWFESEEGKGTTFFVELPLKQNNNSSPLA